MSALFTSHPLLFTPYIGAFLYLDAQAADAFEFGFEIHRDAPYVTDGESEYAEEIAACDQYIERHNRLFAAANRFGWQERMDHILPSRCMTRERRAQMVAAGRMSAEDAARWDDATAKVKPHLA